MIIDDGPWEAAAEAFITMASGEFRPSRPPGGDEEEDENERWRERELAEGEATKAVCPYQVGLLNDLFGNPFRPAMIEPSWLAWSEGAVPHLARAIYEGRRFEDMPILADALEEAGCDDERILAHCRMKRQAWPREIRARRYAISFEETPLFAAMADEPMDSQADFARHYPRPGEHVRGCWVLDLLLGKT
jgi:hypothetical protein